MKLVNFLINLYELDNLNKFIKSVLKNYRLFNEILRKKYEIDIKKFNKKKYSDSNSDENIILLFKLIENKFYKMIDKQISRRLNLKEEIKNNNSNHEYLVIICDDKIKVNIFRVFLIFYYVNLKLINEEFFIGMDLEFNTKVAALIQINFEFRSNIINKSLIFIIDPNIFNDKWNNFFVNYILCNKLVVKILHGSDSLDLPYIYSDLLKSNINLIKKFTKNLIDTKFLCEFGYYVNNLELGKCKIYDILLNNEIITKVKYNELKDNEEKMGHIYDIKININNLSNNLINYTLYDVVYLFELILYYKKNINDFNLINELARVSILSKRKDILIIPKEEVNKINNYIFIKDKKFIKMNDYFNQKFEMFINENILLGQILKINYFKNLINLIFKYETYCFICNNYKIYTRLKNKNLYDNNLLKLNIDYNFLNNFTSIIYKYKNFLLKYKD